MEPTSKRSPAAPGFDPGARLLIVFAEEDRPFALALEEHLAILRDEGLVSGWTEVAHDEGKAAPPAMQEVDMIVPLVSVSLLASIGESEYEQIFGLGRKSDVPVAPVMIRSAALDGLEHLHHLPRNGRPVREWKHPEDAWTDVITGLRERLTAGSRKAIQKAQWSGRVLRLGLKGFTVFEDMTIEPCSGINVFIGLNGTGKSHALKAMYSLLRAPLGLSQPAAYDEMNARLFEKIGAVFKGRIDRLPPRAARTTELRLECEGGTVSQRFLYTGEDVPDEKQRFAGSRAIFLPSREALSMYEGFTSAYERRELSFDETYYDLCKELSASPLREKAIGVFRAPLDALEALIGGTVRIAGTRFIVRSAIGEVEAHMVAEGMRKLASLAYLLRNGALSEQTILFWDEPEANLNPRLVTAVAGVLRQLASLGIQVFIATHDYLLARELSLASEYKTAPEVPIRFFSFHRSSEADPVEVESAETFAALAHNPILDEYRAHYEREQALFYAPSATPEKAA